jgi:hypothetical protein
MTEVDISKAPARPWEYFVGNANGRGLIRIEARHDSDDAGAHVASLPRGAVGEACAEIITTSANRDHLFDEMIEALRQIDDTPCTMVNDSESLRHTIKSIQYISSAILAKVQP